MNELNSLSPTYLIIQLFFSGETKVEDVETLKPIAAHEAIVERAKQVPN